MKNKYVLLLLFGFYFSHAMEQQSLQQIPTLKTLAIHKVISARLDYSFLPEIIRDDLNKRQEKLNRELGFDVSMYCSFPYSNDIDIHGIRTSLVLGANPNSRCVIGSYGNLLETVLSDGSKFEFQYDFDNLVRCFLEYRATVTPRCFITAVCASNRDIFIELKKAAPHIDWKQCMTDRLYSEILDRSIFHVCAERSTIEFCKFLLPQASIQQLHKKVSLRPLPEGMKDVPEMKKNCIEILINRGGKFQQLSQDLMVRNEFVRQEKNEKKKL